MMRHKVSSVSQAFAVGVRASASDEEFAWWTYLDVRRVTVARPARFEAELVHLMGSCVVAIGDRQVLLRQIEGCSAELPPASIL